MKLVISGCRWVDARHTELVADAIEWMNKPSMRRGIVFDRINGIIHGGAAGVDALADAYAKTKYILRHCFHADWDRYGKAAGPIRNAQMAEYGDVLLAIWDHKSRGTHSMIVEMAKVNKPIYVYKIDRESLESIHKKKATVDPQLL